MMPSTSKTTKLLMCAAHLYPDDFIDDLPERLQHPYKFPAPEFGIDLEKIYQELERAKPLYYIKSTILFIITLFTLFIIIQDPIGNWSLPIYALILTSIVELVYTTLARQKVRQILAREDSVDSKEDVNKVDIKNLVISGGFSPFIGAGFDLDSWSFTINIKEAEDKKKPVSPVTVIDLHDYIKEKLQSLEFDDFEIIDQLYVNGKDVNLIPYLLPRGRLCRPVKFLHKKYVLDKFNKDDKRERHYRVARFSMWDGQLFLSMYYRFIVIKNNLFIEARFFLLPPLKERYLEIDSMSKKSTPLKSPRKEFGQSVAKSAITGASSWVGVLLRILSFILGGTKRMREKEWKKEVESNRLYNYGWEYSLREKWSSFEYERYFQKIDKDVALKLLTGEFLTSLYNYLKEKNISTEQFTEASTTIINEGVIISGGEINAESFTVGKGANIVQNASSKVKDKK